ncbi:MAG: efflux RND transporter permease subunit [Proteobacteria bacterium]|nr:efflux RND transporter permease subunit [Pseudomonadota bacterium]
MTLADLSVKRPTFITCIVLLMLAVGAFSITRLGVDLFPDVNFPVVFVSTGYPGAGPSEIETLVSKPIEDELSTLQGVKRLSSISLEGTSQVIAEFTLETDIKYAEQQVRDRVGAVKTVLPKDIKEPVIRRLDPSDQPIVILSLSSKEKLDEGALYDIANEKIRPKLEQIDQVGQVYSLGARKRQIKVSFDTAKLKARELSLTNLNARLSTSGVNIPAGKNEDLKQESVVRTLGQFDSLDSIGNLIINFFGGERTMRVKDLAKVEDSLQDETSRTFLNGDRSLFLYVFKQSGANTVSVVNNVLKRIETMKPELDLMKGKPEIKVVRDGSVYIRANVTDMKESITIGIALAVIVVFFFLQNARSTLITALALPNSLLGAFVLMWASGYTINLMTLLALSLSVGLLIDDAIVVRENIFRHIEMGKKPMQAALEGTKEVTLAVVATTLTVVAVFGPVAFLKGVVGQFFKQFGFVICFAMLISLFDALTIAPMLSAYFASKRAHGRPGFFERLFAWPLARFETAQRWMEDNYESFLKTVMKAPGRTLAIAGVLFVLSFASGKFVPKTFLPPQDAGEFSVDYDLPPGASLDATAETGAKIDAVIRANPEVELSALSVGSRNAEANIGSFYVHLVPSKNRKLNTSQFKEKLREQLKEFASVNPKVKDYDAVGGGQRPFNLNIVSPDQAALEAYTMRVFERLKQNPGMKDIDINFRPGKPEVQLALRAARAAELGVTPATLGFEMRNLIEGNDVAKFRTGGIEYDVRTRLNEGQRNISKNFGSYYVPNLNGNLVKLSDVADKIERTGPSKVNRQDRSRYIQIQADITPGYGMGDVMKQIDTMFASDPELKLPTGMRYAYVGQAENFKELGESMATAIIFGMLFIFLVLASLYESFVTPFTIMLALPPAISGALVALAITQQSLNIFSMIGVIMLLGVAVKNSVLLVDYANQLIREGVDRSEAMIRAGRVRLRPILMTSVALIAGTVPIALGLNEASKQRTSMGIAIIGGLIASTLITPVVVPAAFSYIDRFRVWSNHFMKWLFGVAEAE